MTFKRFLKLVEIQTKVASLLPLLNGTLIAIWLNGGLNVINLLLMFIALVCIDMATTAINQYVDFQKALHREGEGYKGHNAIVTEGLTLVSVRLVIVGLFITATVAGCLLAWRTDYWVLLMGAAAFSIGIIYTFGPFPLSRTPFGEIVSGVTMGFGILLIAVYSQLQDPEWFVLAVSADGRYVSLSLAWQDLLRMILLSVPLVIGIGNIMFANNICDMEEDFKNHRFTLPLSIGKRWSLRLYCWAYIGCYVVILFEMVIGVMPWTAVLVLMTSLPVYRLTLGFVKQPVKAKTFKHSVQAFAWIGTSYAFSWLGAILLLKP